ncbi:MAG: DUF4249 domain-containing protein [Taibaiella sp.]|nr:DUF4249 domain-containing protein [Taibaiella sp.]
MKYIFLLSARSYKLLIALLLLVMQTSCEKEVNINLQNSPAQIVVQGGIETNGVPYVLLTSSFSFFSKVDLGTLQNSFIHSAKVEVSDGIKTITLKEYSLDTGSSFKFYVYTIDTANIANLMLGQNGKHYTLIITHNGIKYTSVTKIPNPQGVDSMWFDKPEFPRNSTPDSAKQMYVNYNDPDTPGDYVRYYTQRDNENFYSSGIFSDEIINGKTVNKIGLIGGYSNDGTFKNRDSLIYFFPGEKVTLKWCAIDKGVYNFWNSLDFAKSAVGNPFSTPINPMTNIKNGALGIWAGYGVHIKTAKVP